MEIQIVANLEDVTVRWKSAAPPAKGDFIRSRGRTYEVTHVLWNLDSGEVELAVEARP